MKRTRGAQVKPTQAALTAAYRVLQSRAIYDQCPEAAQVLLILAKMDRSRSELDERVAMIVEYAARTERARSCEDFAEMKQAKERIRELESELKALKKGDAA